MGDLLDDCTYHQKDYDGPFKVIKLKVLGRLHPFVLHKKNIFVLRSMASYASAPYHYAVFQSIMM